MFSLVNTNQLRQTSPLPGKRPAPSTPQPPQDRLEPADSQVSSNGPKWLLAAFAGLGLVAGGAGAAQAQVLIAKYQK